MLTVKRLIKINKYKNKYTQFKISYIKSHSMLFNNKLMFGCFLKILVFTVIKINKQAF